MQHVFEYYIVYKDEAQEDKTEHRLFVTESSRYSKVAKKILEDLNLTTNKLENFQLRKLR